MIRKLAIAFAAVAAIGTATLTASTTPAAAGHGWSGHHHRHHHHGWYRPGVRFYGPAFAYGGCHVKRVVGTPWGPRVRWVNICH
jgi:hypothetical protein